MRVLKKDGTSYCIREEDILYFSSHQSTIYVHTKEDEYIYPINLSELLAAYRNEGYERLDRSNVVNMSTITAYSKERKVVFFDGGQQKFAPVSEPNESKVQTKLQSKLHDTT